MTESLPGTCHPIALAHTPAGSVTLCRDCGVVQLNTDCVSVRMDPDVFEALAQTMLAARFRLHELRHREAGQRAPSSEVSHAPVH